MSLGSTIAAGYRRRAASAKPVIIWLCQGAPRALASISTGRIDRTFAARLRVAPLRLAIDDGPATTMPIFEYYCERCHTVFSFLGSSAGERGPRCPRCGRRDLPRRPSTFATPRADDGDAPIPGDLDDDRLGSAMESLLAEMQHLPDDAAPSQLSDTLRRFGELSGLEMGPRLEEAIDRLESGEDPDAVEAELDAGDNDEADLSDFFRLRRDARRRGGRRPFVDREIYFL